MLKVLDVFPIGKMLSVTLEGNCENVSIGSKLIDENGNMIIVQSVAMTNCNNPSDIKKSTTILVNCCDVKRNSELSVA